MANHASEVWYILPGMKNQAGSFFWIREIFWQVKAKMIKGFLEP